MTGTPSPPLRGAERRSNPGAAGEAPVARGLLRFARNDGSGAMNLRSVDLNLLVVLDALLTERSVSRAGQRLGLSQPAVSAALTRLRALFGDPLLVRAGRGLALTRPAEDLIAPVREILTHIEQTLVERPAFDPTRDVRSFAISASDYATLVLLTPFVRAL